MRLWLDPGRLAARRITAGDVVNALREQNVQVAAGSIGEAPARKDQTYQSAFARPVGSRKRGTSRTSSSKPAKTARSSGSRMLRGQSSAPRRSPQLRFQGIDAVGLAVTTPDGERLDVEAAVVAELERLAERFPPGMGIESRSTRRRSSGNRSVKC